MHVYEGFTTKQVNLWINSKFAGAEKNTAWDETASCGGAHHGLWPSWRGRRPVAGPAAVWPSSVDLEVDGPLQTEATPHRGEAGPGEVNAGEVFALSKEIEDAVPGAEAMQTRVNDGGTTRQ